MNWLRKWSFLGILTVSGIVFFTVSDTWEVMARPLLDIRDWIWQEKEAEMGQSLEDSVVSAGDTEESGDISGNEAGQGHGAISGNDAAQDQEGNSGGEGAASSEEPPPVTSRTPEEVVYSAVEDDFFADAVFIGDSRTVGMFEYGGLQEISTFYASTGLSIYKLFDSPIIPVEGEKEKKTVEEALSERQFAKIYLMIGINEMGTGTLERFIDKYRETIARLQELQPDAIIYIQGIMKVTTQRSQKGDYINNEGIEARNAEIAKLADNVRVYYLDVNPLICDETGGMESSYTFDGVHLKAAYIPIWKDYLKQHAVLMELQPGL